MALYRVVVVCCAQEFPMQRINRCVLVLAAVILQLHAGESKPNVLIIIADELADGVRPQPSSRSVQGPTFFGPNEPR
jgi:pyridoxal/pyridoxine/pyridoxamine kinase